ncbi:FAD binding domain-containing protein [Exidia glandulosa HHB12029]|uniref:FAD binding domain-containing protein n=1 Tax=Exidia glandulosa HHB12029 TaxID=1314781 RepID=A0A165NH43_EXIGL|nr:FAD binding domain-containing protein [Exidia glandulosa HHB12029]
MWPTTTALLVFLEIVSSTTAAWPSEQLVSKGGKAYSCKCYPGDACYPTSDEWRKLNATVGGNLQVALPPGAPCHNSLNGIPTFDAAKCADVMANFMGEQWTTDQPIANLWTYWTNDTCLPTTDPGTSCTRGFYGDWVILAQTKEHIKAGIDFAREHNLRLVIRNTGHDFMGRSTAFGALVVNTHSFKTVSFTKKYTGPGRYRGGAVTIGAGIQVRELYRLANQQSPPVVVVGGECPTVGLAGGYIQGGGHGPMASFYGMAADNALSFNIVTATGQFATANEAQNADLFWALKGGGPSTFGVVVSLTVKTFPEVPSASVILNINSTHTNDTELFFKGVAAVHNLANHFVDNGMFVYYELMPLRFHVQPIVGPNMTAAQITKVVQPMFDALNKAGVPYSTSTKAFNTFFDLYIDIFEDEAAGSDALIGGRIITHEDIDKNAAGIIDAYKATLNSGTFIIGHIVGPGFGAPVVDNAINPVWRNASSFSITTIPIAGNAPLSDKAQAQNIITNVVGKALREAAPHGGAYVNEGDLEEPNWQTEFWGSHYPRLLKLKEKWDPTGVFYARTTPGTEDWEVIDHGTRLCRKL